jgi:uncharacterized repeat protein (TIGR03843 family)
VTQALLEGDLDIHGRIMPASNITFFADAVLGDVRVPCVYKPVKGERPLWDFPDGTLAGREVAAYAVSEALGWGVVPLTLLRDDGPAGPGMVQEWKEPQTDEDPVDLCPLGKVPTGYLHVLDAVDGEGAEVSLIHEDTAALRHMAVFDVLVNNADRKGGHVLPMQDGHRYGVDHGVCFHVEDKLRTVLWGWAQQPLDREDAETVRAFADRLDDDETFRAGLEALLSGPEVRTLKTRARTLLRNGTMPLPSGSWPSIPWPAF